MKLFPVTYEPNPLNTRSVTLSSQLAKDIELVAKHNHDIWAQGRIAEGWTFGAQRDDERKLHPGLIPYEELSESEKDYDRRSVLESVKGFLALGYQLQTKPES